MKASGWICNKCLLKKAEHTKYFAENFTVIHDNGIHGIIFRLKTVMSVLLVECLNRSRIIYQSDNHITVFRISLTLYKNRISTEDSGISGSVSGICSVSS